MVKPYFYARDSSMNANDSLNNAQGRDAAGNQLAPRPATRYMYPGGNIGGPVADSRHELQQEPRQGVLLLRLRILRSDG